MQPRLTLAHVSHQFSCWISYNIGESMIDSIQERPFQCLGAHQSQLNSQDLVNDPFNRT